MLRAISSSERFMFKSGQEEPIFFTMTARIIGDLTLAELERALSKARQKHLLTAVNVIDDGEAPPYFVQTDPADVPLRIIEDGRDDLWLEVTAQELAILIDATKDPLVRFVWIQGDGFSDLIVVCHHAIADGLSASYLMRDIMTFLGNPELEATPLPLNPGLDQLVPADVEAELLPQIQANIEEQLAYFATATPTPRELPPPSTYVVHGRELTTAQTAVLVQQSRAQETTVHGALGAAFLLAFAQQFGTETGTTRTIQSPINLRPHFTEPLAETMGTFVHIATTEVDCAPTQDFWQVARAVRDGFVAKLTPAELFGFPLMVKQMPFVDKESFERIYHTSMNERPDHADYDFSLSNIGRLDLAEQYGRFQLKSFYGPTFSATVDENVIGVCTVNGRLSFTFIHRPKFLETAVVETIIANALQTVGKAVDW